jgi:hypothetical protein
MSSKGFLLLILVLSCLCTPQVSATAASQFSDVGVATLPPTTDSLDSPPPLAGTESLPNQNSQYRGSLGTLMGKINSWIWREDPLMSQLEAIAYVIRAPVVVNVSQLNGIDSLGCFQKVKEFQHNVKRKLDLWQNYQDILVQIRKQQSSRWFSQSVPAHLDFNHAAISNFKDMLDWEQNQVSTMFEVCHHLQAVPLGNAHSTTTVLGIICSCVSACLLASWYVCHLLVESNKVHSHKRLRKQRERHLRDVQNLKDDLFNQEQEQQGLIFQRYSLLESITNGVFKARDILTGGMVCVKTISNRQSQELTLLSIAQDCVSVIRILHSSTDDKGNSIIVMPLYEPLKSMIDEMDLAFLAYRMLHTVQFLNEGMIAHMDIKPDNIVFDEAGVPFLIDFGVAAFMDRDNKILRVGGTDGFMAPEVVAAFEKHQGIVCDGSKLDIYSLGKTIQFYVDNFLDSPLAPEFAEFYNLFLIEDVDQRPSADELLLHPVWETIEFDS